MFTLITVLFSQIFFGLGNGQCGNPHSPEHLLTPQSSPPSSSPFPSSISSPATSRNLLSLPIPLVPISESRQGNYAPTLPLSLPSPNPSMTSPSESKQGGTPKDDPKPLLSSPLLGPAHTESSNSNFSSFK